MAKHAEIIERVKALPAQIDPVLPAYDQEALVRERAYQDADIGAVLGDFSRCRAEMADSLAALAENAWERAGKHPDWGPMTIREGTERMIRHTEGHLDQVRELKEKASAV